MEKVQERCIRLGDQLSEIHLALTQFSTDADQLERWLGEVTEAVADATPTRLEELVVQRDSRRDRLETVVRDGKALVNKKDVTDTSHVRDRIKVSEFLVCNRYII